MVYQTIMQMLPECSRTAPNNQLEIYAETLQKLLQIDSVREHARSHEGVARLLNSLLSNNPLSWNDFSTINSSDPDGSECVKPADDNSGLNMKHAEFSDAVCELLEPVEQLPEVSKSLLEHSTVVRELQMHSTARGKALLLASNLIDDAERVINNMVSELAPSYPSAQAILKTQAAREAVPLLLTPQHSDTVIEAIVNRGIDEHNKKGTYTQLHRDNAEVQNTF